jgi:CHAT domain-containing protein
MSRPRDALARARDVLAGRPGAYEASVAHQAAGIALRETDDIDASIRELRSALRLARRVGSTEREAEVLGTLGVAFVYAGRTASSLAAFDEAIQMSSGRLKGRVLLRRGHVLWTLGRNTEALDDLRRAVSILQRAGDTVWIPRALSGRGLVYLAMGLPSRADIDFVAAGRLFEETHQEMSSAHTLVNRGVAAYRSGDIPAALALFDEAAARYRLLKIPTLLISLERCDALLTAGLADEALAEADAAVRDVERNRGWSTKKAELLLTAANSALAAGRPMIALDRARDAYRLFGSQANAWGQAHASLIRVQAQYVAGPVAIPLLRAADRTATRLEAVGSGEAMQAHLLAGRAALRLGRRNQADLHLTAASRRRRSGSALARASGWLSEALRAEAEAQPRRLLAACRRGLQLLDEHRFTLGASELRAQATAHGAELATLAQRYAAQAHRPRLFLAWTERWRATALAVPPVRPSRNEELNAGLAALRAVSSQLEEARRENLPVGLLQREQLRLERVVRARALQARGAGDAGPTAFDMDGLFNRLGDAQLIEIVDLDGTLYVLLGGDGRVRQFTAGQTQKATRAAQFARFALRRLARGRPGDDQHSALAILDRTGPELQDAILGPVADSVGDGPLVVVPPGKLHTLPWALLPVLGDRAFTVAPSAGAWMRACTASPPDRRHVTLARGPGLVTDGAEVPLVARLYDDVTELSGGDATSARVLSALDGAWLAHIAAHGTFRADSPLFSSLRMHDGPLTVYDFEQLHRAPYRLILSSCDSGVLAPVGADELLGLISSLLPLGTAGIVAGVVQLNDYAVVPLMVSLHQHLRSGQSLAEAMCSVRRGIAGDLTQRAAAISLLPLGAG